MNQALNRAYSAYNLWFLGYPDRALERASIATAIAHKSGSKVNLSEVHYWASAVYELRRELDHMRERAEVSLAVSSEAGNRYFRALSEISLGWADAMAGDLEGGIARMLRSRRPSTLALIATALGRMRRFDEGLRKIDESFAIIERTSSRQDEAEVHRVKGELLLAQDASNAAQAGQSFRTAIEISHKQHAKSWELRSTTSLARLLAKQDRRDEAVTALAEIYDWFTEGFDTADLKDAKALLDELGNYH
jgi:tetratricopeptide (TPR) repeat protein